MDTNLHEERILVLKEETYTLVGCAIEVLKVVGHGFYEKPYENALVVEMKLRNIPFVQQRRFSMIYKDHNIGEFVPDLIAYDQIIIDAKVVDQITNHERGQMLNYLRITGCKLGLIINFSKPRLEWERVVL